MMEGFDRQTPDLMRSLTVWNFGDIASDGLKQVAEWGAIGTMQKEIKNHVGILSATQMI